MTLLGLYIYDLDYSLIVYLTPITITMYWGSIEIKLNIMKGN